MQMSASLVGAGAAHAQTQQHCGLCPGLAWAQLTADTLAVKDEVAVSLGVTLGEPDVLGLMLDVAVSLAVTLGVAVVLGVSLGVLVSLADDVREGDVVVDAERVRVVVCTANAREGQAKHGAMP